MKNIQKKFILGIATLVAVFGMVHSAFAATAPIMSTSSATSVTTTSATLNGFFNDGGSPMNQVFFDYGTSPILGTLSQFATLPTTTSGNFSVTITGLTPGTTYYVQAVGTNAVGSTWGNPTISFTTKTTSSISPVMSTSSATSITYNSATLNGFYNMNNSSGSVYFEYGTSSGALNSTTSNISVSSNSGNYSANLSGLSPNTTYYYRAVGVNTNGTTRATTILSFTTLAGIYTPPTSTNKCYINSFNASSYYITRGSTVYLSWITTNCTNVTLSPSGYNALSASSYAVYPEAVTNTYTLYASNGSSSDTSYITITTNNGGYNPNPNPSYYPPNFPYYPTGGGTTYRTYDYMYNTNNNNNTNTTNRVYDSVKNIFSGTSKANASSSENSKNTVVNNSTDSTSDSSSLSAAAGMSSGSFFPNTFFGWLIIILIILAIAVIVRIITRKKSDTSAHH